jgi:hypothetical protein
VLLALAETVSAVVAPFRAPSDADWKAAAAHVTAGYQDRDVIVAAPAWADQVMRAELGDLIPPQRAARLDHLSYQRVWEISQRGADAPEAADAQVLGERRFGRLRVRLYQRRALALVYDFQDDFGSGRMARLDPGQPEIPCVPEPGGFNCPTLPQPQVRVRLLEIGATIRRALYIQPVQSAAVVVEYPAVPLGRELAVGAGLNSVWYRRHGDGTVWLRVLVGGKELARFPSTNRSGWRVERIDTSAFRGQTSSVRFEITCDKPFARQFGFAAEARGA